jgi:pimeloyl-ACP methyl ester carboxylesterase
VPQELSGDRRGALVRILQVLLVVLGVAIGHALVLALDQPGPPPPGSSDPGWATSSVAALALMAGGGALIAAAIGAIAVTGVAMRLASVACAAAVLLVVLRDLAWDPYYDNSRRFVENGLVSPGWLLGLALLAAVAPLAIRAVPRLGLSAGGCLLWGVRAAPCWCWPGTDARRAAASLASRAMQLAYDRTGAGPPLVLVHGIGSRRGVWKPVVERLARERDVLCVDLPGFGESPVLSSGKPTVEALARAVRDWWRDELGLERPHVAGNSLGGGIALELARMGAVASATALSPVGFWSPLEARYGRTMLRLTHASATHLGPQLRRIVRSPAGRQATIGLMYGRPRRRDGAEAAEDLVQLARAPGWEATLPMSREYVFRDGAELRAPVTVGWGTRDRLLIPRQAERARALLPQARHVPLPGCGHIPMSDDPDGVAALLLTASA